MDRDFSISNQEAEYHSGFNETSSSGNKLKVAVTDSAENTQFKTLLDEIMQTTSACSVSNSTISIEASFEDIIMQISTSLYEKYPLITIDNEVLGEPRLAGTRFGVSDVLSAFAMYNSIDEIINEYDGRYTEKQLRDAVRFARDFLDSCYSSYDKDNVR